jgi:hypothetical protein
VAGIERVDVLTDERLREREFGMLDRLLTVVHQRRC